MLVDPFPNRAEIERVCAELDARRSAAMLLPAAGTFGATARAFDPALRLLAFGKGPELSALARVAEAAGIEVEARVAGAPGLALGRSPSGCVADKFTAVVLLFHDHEWEEQILLWALTTSAFYIGSIGGSLARQMRRKRLSDLGAGPAEIARIRSPIGTIPSARDPMTLAVSILAEVVDADQERRRQRPLVYPRYGLRAGATAA
ncbi:XdhC family protein [Sphingomonas sp. HF-S4]|uniref:XdhC family protein n=1 Tax=Sphingomonas agrestis TaxID=3080540 RepID=A0ABU3Y9A1_9SPHN|nr:XdhC family protein [Sphingomonas sp. HF-S4]MDV3457936.1 XdhC family protein [Sphingomonas sp. HF-S4]